MSDYRDEQRDRPEPGSGRSFFARSRASLLLATGLLVTCLVYYPGLSGPLLLDDLPNLSVIADWLSGNTNWQWLVFGNQSGPLHRPVSMLTFLANGALSGDSVFWLKAGNLLIHGLMTLSVAALLTRFLDFTRPDLNRPALVGVLLASIWALLPIHVSTVLYTVQRMTQLSALFTVLALIAYLNGRVALKQGNRRNAFAWLFLVVPFTTILATLSKENGLLVPFYCLAIEFALSKHFDGSRSNIKRLFFLAFLVIPTLLALAALAFRWGPFSPGAFVLRDFTMTERLLSESRALWDYVLRIVYPFATEHAVYWDAFPVSRGLLEPATTLIALIAWAGVLAAAILLRRRLTLFGTGVLFFLLGHALESGPLPLEIYFEHRNYLPSLGIVIAVWSASDAVWKRLHRTFPASTLVRQAPPWVFALCMVTLAFGTGLRSLTWSNGPLLTQTVQRNQPESVRALADLAGQWVAVGEPETAYQLMVDASKAGPADIRQYASIMAVGANCAAHHQGAPDDLLLAHSLATSRLTNSAVVALEAVGDQVRAGNCGTITTAHLADLIMHYVDKSQLPSKLGPEWKLKYTAGDLYIAAGDLEKGMQLIEQSWKDGATAPAIGGRIAVYYLEAGDLERSEQMVDQASGRTNPFDARSIARLEAIRSQIAGMKPKDRR